MNKLLSETVCQLSRREALLEMFACLNDIDKLAEVVDKDPVLDCALLCLATCDDQYMANLSQFMDVTELRNDITHCHTDRLRRDYLQKLLHSFSSERETV